MTKSKELAATAQGFIARTQLNGHEVPTYIAVMEWLDTFIATDNLLVEPDKLE